jgi:hypothetical protein
MSNVSVFLSQYKYSSVSKERAWHPEYVTKLDKYIPLVNSQCNKNIFAFAKCCGMRRA